MSPRPGENQVGPATGKLGGMGGGRAHVAAGWDSPADLDKDPALVPDPAEVEVPDDLRARIEAYMTRYPERHSAALPALAAAQEVHGWCSPTAIVQVAAVMRVTPAYLESLTTFYDMLKTEPVGRHDAWVCTGVACHLRQAGRMLAALQQAAADEGLEDTNIRAFECLGACDMAPLASVDGRYVGPLDESDAPEIVRAIKEGRTPLPGRGLEDADYRLPWAADAPPGEESRG